MWKHNNFPNPLDKNENIVLIIRENINIVAEKIIVGFYIFVALYIFRVAIVNLFEDTIWVYFIDMVVNGFFCILVLMVAYGFHNYSLSFRAITTSRIITHTQNNLVNADLSQIWLSTIEKIDIKIIGAKQVADLTGNIIITLKPKNKESPKEQITLENISKPNEVRDILQGLFKH
jgi:hypothetical protein